MNEAAAEVVGWQIRSRRPDSPPAPEARAARDAVGVPQLTAAQAEGGELTDAEVEAAARGARRRPGRGWPAEEAADAAVEAATRSLAALEALAANTPPALRAAPTATPKRQRRRRRR